MEKIKLFFKRDSNFLRNILLVFIGVSGGIYKIFFQTNHRFNSIIIGFIFIIGSIIAIGEIFKDFKRTHAN